MLDYDDNDIISLETYLNNNGYELNSNKIAISDSCFFYYKNPIAILFNENSHITIKDYINNRRFYFESSSSHEIIINFLKYLEKDFILV